MMESRLLKWVGSKTVPVEYIFVEDAAKAMITIGLSTETNKREFNIPGFSETTTEDFLNEISNQGGKNSKLQVLNSNLVFSVMGLFVPVIKEVKEMLYLKRYKLILDGSQYIKKFGALPATPYTDGISKTLTWAKNFYNNSGFRTDLVPNSTRLNTFESYIGYIGISKRTVYKANQYDALSHHGIIRYSSNLFR